MQHQLVPNGGNHAFWRESTCLVARVRVTNYPRFVSAFNYV